MVALCSCSPTGARSHGREWRCPHGRRWVYQVSWKYGDAWAENLTAEEMIRRASASKRP